MILAGLVVASAGLRVVSTWWLSPGWIVPDETVYVELARGLAHGGNLTIVGQHAGFYSFWYPALLAPFVLIGNAPLAAHLVGAAQAFVMSLTAIPVFLWGRRLMPSRYAVLAAGLVLLLPELAYARLLLTETLNLPLFVTALWVTSEVVVKPTFRRQALLLVVLGVAVTSRLQGVVLLLVVPSAIAALAALDRRRPRVADYPLLLGAYALLGLVAAGVTASRGVTGVLGAYGDVVGSYSLRSAARYSLSDFAGLTVIVGFVPAVALLSLAARARTVAAQSRAAAAFLAVACPAAFWGVVEVGLFSSRFAEGRLMDRYLFHLAPLFFLALGYWLQHERRSRRLTLGLAAVLVATLAALPTSLIAETGTWDAPSLISWNRLHGFALPGWTLVLLGAVAFAAVAMVIHRPVLVAAVPATLLLIASTLAGPMLSRAAASDTRRTVGSPSQWVDHEDRGRRAAIVYTGDVWTESVSRLLFWNSSIEHVYRLGATMTGPVPTSPLTVDAAGRVTGVHPLPTFVASSTALTWKGQRLGETSDDAHLALWRIVSPPQLVSWTQGLNEASDLYGQATVQVYSCRGRTMGVRLESIGKPSVITVRTTGGRSRTIGLEPAATWVGTVRLPHGDGPCSASITTSNPIHADIVVRQIRVDARHPG